MHNKLETWYTRVCLGAAALMLTAPFLISRHLEPIPSFHGEWLAIILGLGAGAVLLRRAGQDGWEIPEIALVPLGLMGVAALQWLLLPDALPDRQFVFGGYMAWAFLLAASGRHLARTVGLEATARILAAAVLAGALLQAATGLAQLAGVARLPWAFPLPPDTGVAGGNVAQPNSFADYLWLGIASAIYLRGRGWLGRPAAVACLGVLLPMALLSGSRSVWFYAAGLVLLSGLWAWRDSGEAARGLRNWSIGALAASLVLQTAFSTGLIPLPEGTITAGSRLSSHGAYDSIRMTLWRVAVDVFFENPWLGAGFGQYTRQFHLQVLDLMPQRLSGLPEHPHNILLALLAETGLAGAGLALILGARWCMGLARAPRSPEYWWIAACIGVLGIHSGLEYPLWYAFFLGIAALFAGMGSRSGHRLRPRLTAPWVAAALLVLGLVPLAAAYRDYAQLEFAYNGRGAFRSAGEYRFEAQRIAGRLAEESWTLSSPAHLVATAVMAENGEALPVKLGICDRAQRFSPGADIVFKCAHLLALAGQDEAARLALRRAVAAYPDHAGRVLAQWRRRSPFEPAIAALVAGFPPAAR